jgi:hypothetical protein
MKERFRLWLKKWLEITVLEVEVKDIDNDLTKAELDIQQHQDEIDGLASEYYVDQEIQKLREELED